MRSQRRLQRVALGLAVGMFAGCLYQEEDFVAEYAVEVCRMVRDCGRELSLPGQSDPLPATAECEAVIEAHYSTCASSCEYRPPKARRCLRRLRNNECKGEVTTADPNDNEGGDELIPVVCSFVFEQCESPEQEDHCASVNGCSVGGRPGEGSLLALGLLVLGLGARRRSSTSA